MVLNPLPDFSAVLNDKEELAFALDMARESLRPMLIPGSSARSQTADGILAAALHYFARTGQRTLREFADLLLEFPADAGIGVTNEAKQARAMADLLLSTMQTNPLLRSHGEGLDPGVLLGDVGNTGRVRVSVINLSGLPSLEMQRQFVKQLAMTLFTWLKQNPAPSGREMRGLFAMDEARDFVPSAGNTVCKQSVKRLAAQGRKYHLGLIAATQHPKDLDNGLIANCSTHYYGKANSPAAIATLRNEIQLRNGAGEDIARLPKGHFYVYNADADMRAPIKVKVPMCLSHHAQNPLDPAEVLALATASRLQATGSSLKLGEQPAGHAYQPALSS